MKQKPNMSFWGLWNLSFGFFGVQIAYALQSANVSRIFATLGADPHNLSYFWILPPLMGILVQPIVGTLSDKTWISGWGRRIPYLFVGAAVAVLVMCLLPNSGSLGLTVSAAMLFGVAALMFLDTSINMAMQPFKMLVGDMVNEAERSGLFNPEFPVQCRFAGGIHLPVPLHMARHTECCREGRGARFRGVVILCRRSNPHPMRDLYHIEGEGMES